MTAPLIYNIMPVCTGNICRSVMADMILKHKITQMSQSLVLVNELPDKKNFDIKNGLMPIYVSSTGISAEEQGNYLDPRAKRTLAKFDITLYPHRASHITERSANMQNLLLPMTRTHANYLNRLINTKDITMSNNHCDDSHLSAKKHLNLPHIIMYRAFSLSGHGDDGLCLDPKDYTKPILADDVDDPWYGDITDFEEVFHDLCALSDLVLDYAVKHYASLKSQVS